MRQFLPAPLRGRGQAVPAGFGPRRIGLLPPRRGGDDPVLEPGALAVSDGVEGAQDLGREPARFLEHRIDQVFAEIAVNPFGQRRREASGVFERKRNVGDRRPVGHGEISSVIRHPHTDPRGRPGACARSIGDLI